MRLNSWKGLLGGLVVGMLPACGDSPAVKPPAEDGCEGGLQWGTPQDDEVLDLLLDAQSRLYVAGYEGGRLEGTVDPSGDARGVLMMFEAGTGARTPAWKKVFDTPGTETVEALTVHPSTGAVYFAGRTTQAFPGFTHHGQQDLFVGGPKGDSPFEVLYQGGSERPQHPRQLTFDGEGQLLVAGYDDLYVPGNYVEDWENAFVTKLRKEPGTEQWSEVWWRRFDIPGTDVVGGLAAVGTGGEFYLTGGVAGGAEKGMYLRKLDGNGDTLWLRQYSKGGLDMLQSVHVLPGGDVLVAGSTFSVLGQQGYGGQDVVVHKFSGSTGETIWTYQYGSSDADWVTDMAVDAEGNIAVVGETLGAFEPGFEPRGSFDVFLLRLDARGTPLQVRQWGSPEDDRPLAVALDGQGNTFIGGYTAGALVCPSLGGRDAFLMTQGPQ
jgi:hypothetical protein